MNWFGYKNISKIIMTTTILIILSNTLLISLFYYKNQIKEYDDTVRILKNENKNKQKKDLEDDISHIIEMIEYKYTKKQLKDKRIREEIKVWLDSISFDKQKSNYIFVYMLIDKNGGDNFAKMIINPNRKDIVGKYISTNYKDINGFSFREKFMDDIRKKGDSIVTYAYKKTRSDKIEKKISYFKYYEPLNWIIAKGIYEDDIQRDIIIKKNLLKKRVQNQIKQNIFIFFLLSIVAMIIVYFIGKKIECIINDKNKMVKKTTKDLAILNRELDCRVKKEVEKNKEQEQILMQKSKFIALGETISLIAHQWRQPISELAAIMMNIKLHHRLDKLDTKLMDKKSKEVEVLLEYMSKTIDDFRTFFKPNKIKGEFTINDSIQRVIEITKPMLEEYSINIIQNINKNIKVNSYQNEFEQVILNLISNAKDALISDKINNPKIIIEVWQNKSIIIVVRDNANGIKKELIDKIFDPYFTTKDDAKGTGIGLYMSKIIIEKNMKAKISVDSSVKGSSFKIEL